MREGDRKRRRENLDKRHLIDDGEEMRQGRPPTTSNGDLGRGSDDLEVEHRTELSYCDTDHDEDDEGGDDGDAYSIHHRSNIRVSTESVSAGDERDDGGEYRTKVRQSGYESSSRPSTTTTTTTRHRRGEPDEVRYENVTKKSGGNNKASFSYCYRRKDDPGDRTNMHQSESKSSFSHAGRPDDKPGDEGDDADDDDDATLQQGRRRLKRRTRIRVKGVGAGTGVGVGVDKDEDLDASTSLLRSVSKMTVTIHRGWLGGWLSGCSWLVCRCVGALGDRTWSEYHWHIEHSCLHPRVCFQTLVFHLHVFS